MYVHLEAKMTQKSGFRTQYSGWLSYRVSVLMLMLWAIPAYAYDFAGGTGEPNDPYQIATAEQLISIGDDPNLLDKHFILVNDIDLDPNLPSGRIFDRAVVYLSSGGGRERRGVIGYSGVFDGNGYVIKNFTMECTDRSGALFRGLGQDGVIMNLGLEDVEIHPASSFCEYLAPLAVENEGRISCCYATGNVSDGDIMGGLVGENRGEILYCYSLCNIKGSQWGAGLVGYHDDRDEGVYLWQCYSAGRIDNIANSGALVVEVDESVPLNCYYLDSNELLPDSEWGTALTDEQMRESQSFLGWNFVDVNHPDAPWIMPENGYPQLFYQAGYRPIPDLSGLNVAEAKARLDLVGYRVGNVISDYHSQIDVNSIIVTFPQFYVQGANVDLVVSQGDYDWLSNVGDGSRGNPYQIHTVGQLESLSEHPELYDRAFILRNDLDLRGRFYWSAFVEGEFSGKFDGLGCTLHNMTIISNDNDPMFHEISSEGVVRHLILDNANLYFKDFRDDCGVITTYNYGWIENCSVAGTVIGSNSAFLAYYNEGTVRECAVEGIVFNDKADSIGGGMITVNGDGYVVDCYAQVEYITRNEDSGRGKEQLGGLIGEHWGDEVDCVSRCYAATLWDIESPNEFEIGGVIGGNDNDEDSISNCYYLIPQDDTIVLSNGIGIPLTEEGMVDQNSFENWDFWGNVEDGQEETWFMPEGGYPRLTWQMEGYLCVPEVSLMVSSLAQELIIDAGLELGQVIYDYSESTPVGAVILTQPSGIVEIGAEIDIVVSLGSYVWQDNAGQGTATDPYEIASAGQLLSLSNHSELYGCHFDLVNDIDLDGYTLEKALIAAPNDLYDDEYSGTPFSGCFNGGLHKIQNLFVSARADGYYGPCYLGLFGYIAPEGRVIQLMLKDVTVSGDHDSYYLGTLCARNEGAVQSCSASGTVSYRKYSEVVGGLVGDNQGEISQCAAECRLILRDARESVPGCSSHRCDLALPYQKYGGLVGLNSGVLSDCYATGSVQGSVYSVYSERDLGGLVGLNSDVGQVSYSYYLGWVYAGIRKLLNEGPGYGIEDGNVLSCYTLDPNEYVEIEVRNITCLSRQEMMQQESYVGWDFVGETTNGNNDIWWMPEEGSPRLWWEKVE